MATIRVANFTFVQAGMFTLPGIRTTPGKLTHIRSEEVMHFDLPNDVRDKGMLSFWFDTQKGVDDGISLAFEVSVGASKYGYVFNQYVVSCFQLPVFGLKKGDNWVRFDMSKGGTVTIPDPNESLGGKGVANIGRVCLTYHRDVAI